MPLLPLPASAPKFWFVLGREPLVSAAELYSLLPASALLLQPPLLFCSTKVDPASLMEKLGGTVKIGETLASQISENEVVATIVNSLQKQPGKLVFGLSWYGPGVAAEQFRQVQSLGYAIKKALTSAGRSARLIIKDTPALASVTVAAQKLPERGGEFLLWNTGAAFSVAQTAVVQPFSEWGQRDYGRPGRDDRSGMLPPKLARILLNLARVPVAEPVLDPFCGSGTILTEALLLGYATVIGADIADGAVKDSETNIAWLKKNQAAATGAARLLQADVADLSKKISRQSVGGIVTEPYLGPPLRGAEPAAAIQKNCAELAALYTEAFRNFSRVLKPGGAVVFVVPQFHVGPRARRVAELFVPKIKKLGFIPEPLLPPALHAEPYLLYRRPGQRVGREIWRFTLAG